MANPSLMDIAILNKAEDGKLIEESIQAQPEVRVGAWGSIKGIAYPVAVRTALPTVGFRDAGEGVAPVKSTYVDRLIEAKIVDASVEVDKQIAERDGNGGASAFLAKEAKGLLEAAWRALGSQFYYGRNTKAHKVSAAANPEKGFLGLADSVSASMVVDAGGTTDDTASSVWAVKFGDDFVRFVLGNDGAFAVEDAFETRLTDGSSNPYDGYRMPITAYVGLQAVNPLNSIACIGDLTEDSGKTLTDALLYDMLDKFPSGVTPDAIFMARRSRTQWRAARTATNPTGVPAPYPTEFEGVPIYATDSISIVEKINLLTA